MRKAVTTGLLIGMLLAACAGVAAPVGIGEKVGDFKLQDTAGNTHSLASYGGKVVVLVFWSFKCPTALAYDERLAALQQKYGSGRVVVLAVASNSNESKAEILRNAGNLNLSFAILLDRDGLLADRLGATITPSIYILDRGGVLRYRGALDNKEKPGDKKREAYAEDAIDSLLAGQAVTNQETQASGCSIKRKP
ncbi:MAG TPA: redoxin domain-containing protein [Acidobacteriota bacterium]|nr:redoxin domain-containing protein [Acidobacteriota bacterium]